MKHVTKSVNGRHQISDEIGHFRGYGVTKSVTSLLTIYYWQRQHGETTMRTFHLGGAK